MQRQCRGLHARSRRSRSIAPMARGGAAISLMTPRPRSRRRSGAILPRFRTRMPRLDRLPNLATSGGNAISGLSQPLRFSSEPNMTETATAAESQPFQAEVAELLNLMVHSVYSETDIFLRELVSNASDACDKLRYEAISAPELITDGAPPVIRIAPDKKANTLSVVDTGIGMDRQELIDNLGTIARSGTKSFLSRLTEAKDGAGLIGQFGVGFYAAFMVAERIVVTSRRAGSDEAWVWSSAGGAGFEIGPAGETEGARIGRGTEIVLHLKDDAKKYLEG